MLYAMGRYTDTGIMEHIERGGGSFRRQHRRLSAAEAAREHLRRVACLHPSAGQGSGCAGMINAQYVVYEGELYLLEVNPRSSRTVPFMSKVTGIPLVKLAVKVSLGQTLKELGYRSRIIDPPSYVSVKAPVFSFGKIMDLDTVLGGPEMKSTGGSNRDWAPRLHRHFTRPWWRQGFSLPAGGRILATIADKDKEEAMPIIRGLADLGYEIMATQGTANFLERNVIPVKRVRKVGGEGSPHIIDLLRNGGEINLVLNTLTKGGKIPRKRRV